MKAIFWRAFCLGIPVSVFAQVAPTESNLRAGGTISFSSNGTIPLTTPVAITTDTSIDANGHQVVIDGQNVTRLFVVNSGVKLTLKNLTLANGRVQGANSSSVSLSGESVSGGAIRNNGGVLTAIDCVFSNNVAQAGSGYVDPFATFNSSPGGIASGGAIEQTGGSSVLTGCNFTVNSAFGGAGTGSGLGGAIDVVDGSLSISNAVFLGNKATSGNPYVFKAGSAEGGAILIQSGTADIRLASFSQNASVCPWNGSGFGGAVAIRSGTLTVADSNFEANSTTGGMPFPYHGTGNLNGIPAYGGGVYIGASATLTITRSLLSGNTVYGGLKYPPAGFSASDAPGRGGALSIDGTAAIINSTLVGNRAFPSSSVPISQGAAIYNAGAANLTNVTVVNNISDHPAVLSAAGTFTVINSLFGQNGNVTASGGITDAGHNLSATATPAFTQSSSQNNLNLRLGPLGQYGGPTATIPLMAGSPAINAAEDSAAPTTDQRGRARPFGSHSDVGAFESSSPFYLLGSLAGRFIDATSVTLGANHAQADAGGKFLIASPQGSVSIQFSSPNHLFGPNPFTLDVQSDMEIRARGFEIDKLDFYPEANSFVYAGRAGETWQFDASPDLATWLPIRTNTFASDGLLLMPATNITTSAYVRGIRR